MSTKAGEPQLVENWLDSASERSYQIPFCQMLIAKGHRILHSTRHHPIELGKDVNTRHEDGTFYAFQLKGDPGGRMTLSDYREIEPQLRELVTLPIDNVSYEPNTWHRAFLVTNGVIEEDVRLAIERLNHGFQLQGLRGRLEFQQRGDLLRDAVDLGSALWPSEIQHTKGILEFLVRDGTETLDLAAFDALIRALLGLDSATPLLNRRELERRVTSAALLTQIALARFAARSNHWAVLQAWVVLSAYIIAAREKHRGDDSILTTLETCLVVVRTLLTDLAVEVLASAHLVEGDPAFDSYLWRARKTLLSSLLSVLYIWNEGDGETWPTSLDRSRVVEFLNSAEPDLDLWGEASIPQWLAYYWYRRRTTPAANVEGLLIRLLRQVLAGNADADRGLAPPYFTIQDVARHRLVANVPYLKDLLENESLGASSYFAEALLHLLVRTNRKVECKTVWSQFSRRSHISFVPGARWRFCLWRDEAGHYVSRIAPETKQWNDLVTEARNSECPQVPEDFQRYPLLLLLFIVVAPHRALPEVVRWLGSQLDRTWIS